MPISGAAGNFCVFGAEPSSGGKGKLMPDTLQVAPLLSLIRSAKPFAPTMSPVNPEQPLNLDDMERDLADVELALGRLENGTYWTDELTGAPLDSSHLATNPTARRNPA